MSTKIFGATRTDVHNIRHDNKNVEIRMVDDPNHPDYDPRVDLPVDRELMESIRMVGQLEPATGYKDDLADGTMIIWLIFGRQRWKAIRSIWEEMSEKGEDMELAPAFKVSLQRTEDAIRRRQKRIIENRHRQELSGLSLAREVCNHLEIVGNDEQSRKNARILFNFKSIAAMDNCLALLDTTPKVQGLLAAGAISSTAALQLSRQPSEIQDQVAERIEESAESEDEPGEDEGGDQVDPAQIDAFEHDRPQIQAASSAPASRPASVSEVKDMIRDASGQQSYAVVTLKQIEKEIERRQKDREKILDKVEKLQHVQGDDAVKLMARIAEADGWIAALKWARGETIGDSVSTNSGNDKASAAWDALRESIMAGSWPELVLPADFHDDEGEANTLRIAGELVAVRRSYSDDSVIDVLWINVSTKYVQRVVDPYGKIGPIMRLWRAHGWIQSAGKFGESTLCKFHHGGLGRVMIRLEESQVKKWTDNAPWPRKVSIDSNDQEQSVSDDDEKDHSDRKCPHCGSSDVSPFVAGTEDGTLTDSGMICDECDMAFDTAEKAPAE